MQLFGSADPPDPPGLPEVVDELPQPTRTDARAAVATKTRLRRIDEFRSLKLLSVLTIGFREFGKIGSREEICEVFG